MTESVILKVNGEPVLLNPFVRKALSGTVLGFIQSLDKIPQPAVRIEIVIEADAARR